MVGAEFAWRFLVIVAALGVVVWVIGEFALLSTCLAIALLLSALLAPGVEFLNRRTPIPRGLAVAIAIVGGLAVLGGLITFVIAQFADGLPALQKQLGASLDEVRVWLTQGPLALQTKDINNFISQGIDFIKQNQESVTVKALTTAGAVGEFMTGLVLVLFILIFFLINGEMIWKFLLYAIPAPVRPQVNVAGRQGFRSLVSFVRATAIVAVVDAVGIGVGMWILGVQLVVPIATLVFIGAFVPVVGAVVTGAVAVMVALVTVGWIKAVILLGIVIAVMQIEGHVLQPFLLGKAVKLHPLAVILAIAAGMIVASVTGALLAVPLVAVLNAGAKSLLADEAATAKRGAERRDADQDAAPDENAASDHEPAQKNETSSG